MFCLNCGQEVKEGLKFCTNCGAKLDEDVTQADPEATVQINSSDSGFSVPPDKTQVINPAPQKVQPNQNVVPVGPANTLPVGFVQGNQAASQTQQMPGQIQPAKSSKAPMIALIVATVVIVFGGAFGALAIAKPPIEFLKDTPFSSVTSQTNETKSSEKKETKTEDSSKKDDTSSNSSNSNSNNSSNNNSNNSSNNNSNNNNSNKSKSNTYVLKDSATKKLTSSDISGLTDDQICIAQNEIWARHGRKFKNNWLQSYFNNQSWYSGTIEADDFLNKYTPSKIEDENASFLSGTLSSRGYDVSKAHPN